MVKMFLMAAKGRYGLTSWIPKARMACDLKTDDGRLMNERIKQIRRYLPIEYRDFEIIVVRPQE